MTPHGTPTANLSGTKSGDPSLERKLRDFESGIEALAGLAAEAHQAAAEKLCEMSRDVRFALGPVREAPPEVVERIAGLFRAAADAIRPDRDPQIVTFQNNIRQRADILLSTL